MSTTKLTPDLIEKTAERLSKASERFVKDIEKQIHQIDKRIKAFVDQGESATTKLVETLDRELRSQITALRKEVEHLSKQISSMLPGPAAPKTTPKATARPAAKRTAKSTRPPAKAAVRKAPAKRVAA